MIKVLTNRKNLIVASEKFGGFFMNSDVEFRTQ
jgi:hypothetical protein